MTTLTENPMSPAISQALQAGEMLRLISAGTATATGADFFYSLVRHLAVVMQVDSAFLTECSDDSHKRVRTLAFLKNNRFAKNYEYELEGTPCEGVIAGSICYYAARVPQMFPQEEGRTESFLGLPMHGSTGEILGHLAVSDLNPMPRQMPAHWQEILQIFAARAGAELERLRALNEVQRAMDELEYRVATRTAELSQANAQLRQEIAERKQIEEEREKLIAELDAFAHTVAHDLKNPLTGILAYAELQQAAWANEAERQRATEGIVQNGRKMNNINWRSRLSFSLPSPGSFMFALPATGWAYPSCSASSTA